MTIDRRAVGAIQMTCRPGDREANLAEAERLLRELSGQAEIACLPELFGTGYDLEALRSGMARELAEPIPEGGGPGGSGSSGGGIEAGPTLARLCELAAELDLALVAGVIERNEIPDDLPYITAVLIDRSGRLVGRYRKSHLHPTEQPLFRAGDELPVFALEGLRVGVAICYEAAFPPIFQTLARAGAQIVFNPSAVPVGYAHLQDVRTRARAQDNQIFVVAANHVGSEGATVYCGRSQVADPRGDVLVMAPDERPAAVRAELELELIREQRLQEPVFLGSRPELYRG